MMGINAMPRASSIVKAGTGSVDVCESASRGVKKTKKRLLFFSSECLEKLYLFVQS